MQIDRRDEERATTPVVHDRKEERENRNKEEDADNDEEKEKDGPAVEISTGKRDPTRPLRSMLPLRAVPFLL